MNQVMQTILNRRSIRKYTDQQLSEAQIDQLLQAAHAAPSSINMQPWFFSVVTNAALLDEMNERLLLIPKLKLPKDYHVFFHAPCVIFLFTPKQPPTRFAKLDCGLTTENVALAAASLGLGSVILGTPDEIFFTQDGDYFQSKLQVPSEYEFAIAIAVGVADEQPAPHSVKPGRDVLIR